MIERAVAPSISFYAGPVTKHPLIEKYLYGPLRELTTSLNNKSSSSSKLYKTYSSDSSQNKSSSRINEFDNNKYQSTRSRNNDFRLNLNYDQNNSEQTKKDSKKQSSYMQQQATSRYTTTTGNQRKTLGIGNYVSNIR